ncbi:MAG TPA: glycosyltransferase family 39 protein [Pyrinomonadaceae bacterium]|nr:glycosyltransferase family 39 protein [Pyrinomonadaceae bacterium]
MLKTPLSTYAASNELRNDLSAQAQAIITAGLRPELFAGRGILSGSRTLIFAALTVLILGGFGFRLTGLSAEGLSEDELNKLNAVADYRAHGLTGANGEHPMLMKALQAASIIAAEKWNNTSFVASHPAESITPETALRLPGTILGAFTALLIYLITAELFGAEVALIAAALWAFDPTAIGFSRIAKEDTFLLFFFLLANVFWLRGQRVAESTDRNPTRYYWLTGAAYGAMMASKYVPHLIAISMSYYWMFQKLPETRWRLGFKRILKFFVIMGIVFLILSPTILLPETWHQMGLFAGSKRIGHDGYEFMGKLYSQRFDDWLQGIPVYFYVVFTWVKLPLLSVIGFLIGLPLLFRRKLGDGRYFVGFWLFLWAIAFCFPGGKFTRYYTTVLPAVLITAALGIQFAGRTLARWIAKISSGTGVRRYVPASLAVLAIGCSVLDSSYAGPHFRLFTNSLGGSVAHAGTYFPHDEFYDASMRDTIMEIAHRAQPGAHVGSESPLLASYYAQRANRNDLVCVSLSDPDGLKQLGQNDFVIVARGRRYFSNDELISALSSNSKPDFQMFLGTFPSVDVYHLKDSSLEIIKTAAQRRDAVMRMRRRGNGGTG